MSRHCASPIATSQNSSWCINVHRYGILIGVHGLWCLWPSSSIEQFGVVIGDIIIVLSTCQEIWYRVQRQQMIESIASWITFVLIPTTVIHINFVSKIFVRNFLEAVFLFISMHAIYSPYIVLLVKKFRMKISIILCETKIFLSTRFFVNYGIICPFSIVQNGRGLILDISSWRPLPTDECYMQHTSYLCHVMPLVCWFFHVLLIKWPEKVQRLYT